MRFLIGILVDVIRSPEGHQLIGHEVDGISRCTGAPLPLMMTSNNSSR
jgi:hypothetical protein